MNNPTNPVDEIYKICQSSPHFNFKKSVNKNELLQDILHVMTAKEKEKECNFLTVSLCIFSRKISPNRIQPCSR